ncbi:hypothetical protein [Magnetospirillum sp. UT-4]|uniref:hypothetical protein n=1 Tax=Magnetospirillum sp. UT-4 TaxID=2681467 RepID=UPI00138137BE|nr:hypothetical protein [Magnetospirillum sp. UT-4]CAA7612134.1 hypothetical protein MTBUT4_110063 [Magnetospirillum sp. UT-4]
MASDPPPFQPVYFIVVVWGDEYRDYLCRYCLPSLTTTGNFGSLPSGAGHRLLVCTTPADWERLKDAPAMVGAAAFVQPELVPIPPRPDGVSNCQHMGVGHKAATDIAFRAGALVVHLTPDMVMSEGAIAAVLAHWRRGKRVVLAAALRCAEEPLFDSLARQGVFASRADDQAPLPIPSRTLTAAVLSAFHSETLSYEFDSTYLAEFLPAAWWRVADGRGAVVHSMSWAPILLDYAAITDHDTSMLSHWTLDGNYIDANFGADAPAHAVLDSDELMVASWAPAEDRRRDLAPSWWKGNTALGRWYRRMILWSSYRSPVFDDTKRNLFRLTVRWHAGEMGPDWADVERRAGTEVAAVAGPAGGPGSLSRWAFRLVARLREWPRYAYLVRRGADLTVRALSGEADARRRLAFRFRDALAGLGRGRR